ncbi:MAG: hypothetical protein WCV70_04125 [Patescibacteria group bacterium]
MKRILAVLAVVFLSIVFVILPAEAKEEVSLENGTLIITEIKEIKRIPNVPKGLSPEDADRLVKGSFGDKIVVKGKKEKTTFIFSFPVQVKREYSDSAISYGPATGWSSSKIPRTEIKSDFILSNVLLMSAIFILTVSIINRLSIGMKIRNLFLFYGCLLAIVIIETAIAAIDSFLTSIGIVAVIGVFLGWLAGTIENKMPSRLLMGSTGVLVGLSANVFLSERYEAPVIYFVFLAAACLVSLVIAYAGSFIKKRLQSQTSPK